MKSRWRSGTKSACTTGQRTACVAGRAPGMVGGTGHPPPAASRLPCIASHRISFSFLVLGVLLAGCNRGGSVPVVVTGPKSSVGWEVRYNATVALARRGSDKVKDEGVWDNLTEMLDEEQQLRNFRREAKDGKEVSEAGAAHLTVITALQAVDELHKKRPDMDLSRLNPTLEKLTHSRNLAVSTEAKRTQQLLSK
jgi:hypothetical protein